MHTLRAAAPATHANKDTPTEAVRGAIRPIRRKAAKRKAKEKIHDLLLDLIINMLSTLKTTNTKNHTMFERYVIAQEKMADAALQVAQLK